MSRRPLIVCVLLLAAGPAARAEGGPGATPVEVTVCLHDGTVLRRVVLPASVEVVTRYGKLTVPVKDVRRIEVGFRLTAQAAREVEEAVQALGGRQYREREAAVKRLVGL